MIKIGSLDRVTRFLLGALLAAGPFLFPDSFAALGGWHMAVAAVGVVLIVTALVRICPAYLLFGIRTCARGRA